MGIHELPVPDGLVLRPFRGVRFTVDEPARVTSPPYDLISDGDVRVLLNAHPNNVVRLILPGASPSFPPTSGGASSDPSPASRSDKPLEERYVEARDTLRAWLDSGVLASDERPALYVYEQSGPGVLQRGIIGDVALTDPARRIILPHEDVLPGPVADRLALMSTTQANLEPIFLLYDGAQSTATTLVDEVAVNRAPLVSARTEDGLDHRLWAITDQAEIDAVNADLRSRQALIADGHHRYATYRMLQRQEHAARATSQPSPLDVAASSPPGASGSADERALGPWDFGLALLVDSSAYPPDLKAIHRVVPGLPLDEAAARAKGSWRVQDHPTLTEGLAALDAAPEPAFLIAGEGGCHLLTNPDPVQLALAMPADRSDRWNSLNTSILTEFVMPRVWGMRDDEQAVRVVHHDAEAAARLAVSMGGTAVILKPLAVEDVLAVAASGERVPRKSTSFGPKPRTGLVLRTFAID
ncbi:DUF1015 family protein [Nonomuraea cavernae]|uniref:DUF1015 domain-containing protein n=1 Tax=Nonomuraea cavernae TaxID=2045107 RepID=A0A917Z8F7_9ACTN|nr:DUF1015 domain-containing protein [Nonomuraea cavernae]MCA2189048.1 DUF1015 domain-containing protein [Nonomuraea cavernae]GGO76004.1 hypothetical protein GCM10012289_52360 [Nonomuraea cavernae]